MNNIRNVKSDAFSDAVCSLLDEIARDQGCTREELIQAAMRKQRDTPGSSVTAIMAKPQTTIDGATGNVRVDRAGVFKGFGKGFRDYVMKGPQHVSVGAETRVGQLPQGHQHAGKYCIQVNIFPFDSKILANEMADGQITPMVEAILGGRAVVSQ